MWLTLVQVSTGSIGRRERLRAIDDGDVLITSFKEVIGCRDAEAARSDDEDAFVDRGHLVGGFVLVCD